MTVKGIDVSSYQSSTYSTAGLGFVWVKATESTTYVNPRHDAQVAHARAAGCVVGHYHFQRPGSWKTQADHFAAHAGVKAGDLIAVDWEDTGVVCANKDALIRELQRQFPRNRVLLYCNTSFWKARDTTSFAGDGLWIAAPSDPDGRPSITHPWVMQQTGIDGTDVDIADFASLADLRAWAAKGGTPPKTTTAPGKPAASTQEDDMPTAKEIAAAVWDADVIPAARPPHANADYAKNTTWQAKYALQTSVEGGRATAAQLTALSAAVKSLAAQLGKSPADVQTIVSAVEKAVTEATIHVTISGPGPDPAKG